MSLIWINDFFMEFFKKMGGKHSSESLGAFVHLGLIPAMYTPQQDKSNNFN